VSEKKQNWRKLRFRKLGWTRQGISNSTYKYWKETSGKGVVTPLRMILMNDDDFETN